MKLVTENLYEFHKTGDPLKSLNLGYTEMIKKIKLITDTIDLFVINNFSTTKNIEPYENIEESIVEIGYIYKIQSGQRYDEELYKFKCYIGWDNEKKTYYSGYIYSRDNEYLITDMNIEECKDIVEAYNNLTEYCKDVL